MTTGTFCEYRRDSAIGRLLRDPCAYCEIEQMDHGPVVRIPEPKNGPQFMPWDMRSAKQFYVKPNELLRQDEADAAWPASPILAHYGTPVDGFSPACCPRCGIRWESGDLRPVDNRDRPTQWHCSDCGQSWTMMPRGFDTTD